MVCFYLKSVTSIWVIFPREAKGPGVLLVAPGFSGELGPVLQAACVPGVGTY